mmetsp:Transcript_30018/g.76022  ORF Transcript_30018/g.76022 Transcript_30018/m.76022 type:complete len:330 (+) Transcript_30018:1493-2482(+)
MNIFTQRKLHPPPRMTLLGVVGGGGRVEPDRGPLRDACKLALRLLVHLAGVGPARCAVLGPQRRQVARACRLPMLPVAQLRSLGLLQEREGLGVEGPRRMRVLRGEESPPALVDTPRGGRLCRLVASVLGVHRLELGRLGLCLLGLPRGRLLLLLAHLLRLDVGLLVQDGRLGLLLHLRRCDLEQLLVPVRQLVLATGGCLLEGCRRHRGELLRLKSRLLLLGLGEPLLARTQRVLVVLLGLHAVFCLLELLVVGHLQEREVLLGQGVGGALVGEAVSVVGGQEAPPVVAPAVHELCWPRARWHHRQADQACARHGGHEGHHASHFWLG